MHTDYWPNISLAGSLAENIILKISYHDDRTKVQQFNSGSGSDLSHRRIDRQLQFSKPPEGRVATCNHKLPRWEAFAAKSDGCGLSTCCRTENPVGRAQLHSVPVAGLDDQNTNRQLPVIRWIWLIPSAFYPDPSSDPKKNVLCRTKEQHARAKHILLRTYIMSNRLAMLDIIPRSH